MTNENLKHLSNEEEIKRIFFTNEFYRYLISSVICKGTYQKIQCHDKVLSLVEEKENQLKYMEFSFDKEGNLVSKEEEVIYQEDPLRTYETLNMTTQFHYLETVYDKTGIELEKKEYHLRAKKPVFESVTSDLLFEELEKRYPNWKNSSLVVEENLIDLSFPESSYQIGIRDYDQMVRVFVKEKKGSNEEEYTAVVDLREPKPIDFKFLSENKVFTFEASREMRSKK